MENIEIKARVRDMKQTRERVKRLNHRFVGLDKQVDTYFKTKSGRLKLRESSLSGPYLVIYQRENENGPRSSIYQKLTVEDPDGVKQILESTLGLHIVVAKNREIYLYENVRIHLDEVHDLGTFLELEAVMGQGFNDRGIEEKKVRYLMQQLGVDDTDLIATSYEQLKASG
ncbi:MAG: class IV adenylate cyclase, partial [Calditrichales bacterium]